MTVRGPDHYTPRTSVAIRRVAVARAPMCCRVLRIFQNMPSWRNCLWPWPRCRTQAGAQPGWLRPGPGILTRYVMCTSSCFAISPGRQCSTVSSAPGITAVAAAATCITPVWVPLPTMCCSPCLTGVRINLCWRRQPISCSHYPLILPITQWILLATSVLSGNRRPAPALPWSICSLVKLPPPTRIRMLQSQHRLPRAALR